jgi:hypothetical protein
MKAVLLGAAVAAGLLSVSLDYAQAQTAGSVAATCKDGSAFSGDSRRGACRGHGGVKTWNDAGGAPSSAASPTAVTPAAPVTNPTAPTTSARPAPLAPAAPAASAGGGAGQVWANSSTRYIIARATVITERPSTGPTCRKPTRRLRAFMAITGRLARKCGRARGTRACSRCVINAIPAGDCRLIVFSARTFPAGCALRPA